MFIVVLLHVSACFQIPHKPHRRTIHRLLNKMGFRSIRASRKPLLSRINIKKRLEYARQHRRFDWSRVIFSDEKLFRLRPGNPVRCVSPLGVGLSLFVQCIMDIIPLQMLEVEDGE